MDWEAFMAQALALADHAAEHGDVPVGALIVRDSDGAVIGTGFNCREAEQDPLGHAEIQAIRSAASAIGNWRLSGCTLYVTLEPCPMCTGAILQSRLDRVIFGAFDKKAGCCGSVIDLTGEPSFESHPALYGGVLEEECTRKMQTFS